jgi:hypothetical protein
LRFIKLALISFILLFLVATGVSLMIPSQVRISKATNIASSPDSILAPVKDQQRWASWHPAYMNADSFPVIHFKTLVENDSVYELSMQQGEKTPVISGWHVYRHGGSDSLTLQWYMDFRLKWYPWQKFSSLFFESTYGAMMEKGLSNLKEQQSH